MRPAVVAGDVADELDCAGGAVVQGDFAVGADGDDDEVWHCLGGVEVEVGCGGSGGAVGVGGDVSAARYFPDLDPK